MNSCFFIRPAPTNGNGGGNMLSAQSMIVRRNLAIGDSLCATVVADRLIAMGYDVIYQTHPAVHCVIRRHPLIAKVTDPGGYCDVDLDGAYEKDPTRRLKHFHQMFFERANEQLARYAIHLGEPLNCRPRLVMPGVDKAATRKWLSRWPRPWVFICPRSESFNVRQVPDGIWAEAAPAIKGTKFWLGRHPAPKGIVDLKASFFDHVVNWLSVADLLISVDTGPLHVAAAFGVPIVAINQSSSPELHLSDLCDFVSISPPLDCLNCQLNVCPRNSHIPPCQNIDPALIAKWANAKLHYFTHDGVSAVVAIYRPDLPTLNRCLDCLIPQVDEIIVTAEANSILPAGHRTHEKIRYVRKNAAAIGYGRNANFGVRHSTHRWLLLLNDDVFIDPGAVAHLREISAPDVGMVSNLLRYPDGTIYHCGKRRAPGVRGWGHIDHKQTHCSLTGPTEMENVNMACCLVRRDAFYQIGCFDEDYFIYGEDDDFSLRMRRGGWRIFSQPHSTGVHMEHQSTKKIGDIMTAVQRANAIFDRKWGAYLTANANRIPGHFDY